MAVLEQNLLELGQRRRRGRAASAASAGRSARELPSATLSARPVRRRAARRAARRRRPWRPCPDAPASARCRSRPRRRPAPGARASRRRPGRRRRATRAARRRCAARSSGIAKVTTPQPSMPVPTSAGSSSAAAATSSSRSCCSGWLRAAVALDRPAVRAADGEHPGVLAGAVVVDLLRRAAVLDAAVELVLAAAGRGQQLPHRLDVARPCRSARRRRSRAPPAPSSG